MCKGLCGYHSYRYRESRLTTQPRRSLGEIIIELPTVTNHCPMGCRHCIHEESSSTGTPLTDNEIQSLLFGACSGKAQRITLYPHRQDITLLAKEYLSYFQYIDTWGIAMKTITAGASPAGLGILLPYLSNLSFSLDSLRRGEYCQFRTTRGYEAMCKSLKVLAQFRKEHDLVTTALVLVDHETIDTLQRRCEEIWETGLFDRIKVRELLPMGKAAGEKLLTDDQLLEISSIKSRFCKSDVQAVQSDKNCCSGWGKYRLSIGPAGEITDCVLLFYSGKAAKNIRSYPNIGEMFTTLQRGESSIQQCEEHVKCGGGCLARELLQ